jgi:NAD(P)H-dependent flavin oxidoreductase YrpB (nitropropane dioxygenase family)
MYQAPSVSEAIRGARAGADVIVAQGSEGGGHIGVMGTMALVPMVVRAVQPTPVLAAGGIADGHGLAAALALGAEGALLGTRFLATVESPLHPNFKQALVESDGHDTDVTTIPDLVSGRIWPGALARVKRNALIRTWAGREWSRGSVTVPGSLRRESRRSTALCVVAGCRPHRRDGPSSDVVARIVQTSRSAAPAQCLRRFTDRVLSVNATRHARIWARFGAGPPR